MKQIKRGNLRRLPAWLLAGLLTFQTISFVTPQTLLASEKDTSNGTAPGTAISASQNDANEQAQPATNGEAITQNEQAEQGSKVAAKDATKAADAIKDSAVNETAKDGETSSETATDTAKDKVDEVSTPSADAKNETAKKETVAETNTAKDGIPARPLEGPSSLATLKEVPEREVQELAALAGKADAQNLSQDREAKLRDTDSQQAQAKRVKVDYSELNPELREQNFDANWLFKLGESTNAEAITYDDANWRNLTLPHDYSKELAYDLQRGEGESGYKLGGVAWYRKSFNLPESLKGKQVRVEFDGVYNNATVYINGTKLGSHPYGYSNFAFDLTKYLNFGGNNVLAVKVDHKFPSSRWYSGSGIYRDVKLVITAATSVARHGVVVTTPDLATNQSNPQVNIQTKVVNNSAENASLEISQTVLKDGTPVSSPVSQTVELNANQSQTVTQQTTVNNPTLWSLDNPSLYTVKTEVKLNGEVVDTVLTKFGFRFFKFERDTGFSLNGQRMKLKGVCMHHDQGALGAAAYRDAIARQIDILKAMGANAIRITHNPGAEVLLDLASEKGILLIDEMFDTWTNQKNYNTFDYSGVFEQPIGADNQIADKTSDQQTWAEFDLKSTVAAGINQPAIIMWSIGNEICETTQYAFGKYPQIAGQLCQWIKDVDATRPATIGDNKIKANNETTIAMAEAVAKAGGIVGLNYADANVLSKYHKQKQNWTIYASESSSAINSRGIYNEPFNGSNYNQGQTGSKNLTSYDRSRVGWGHTSAESWSFVASNDFVAGEFVWTGFDYLGEPTPWNGVAAGPQGGNNSPKSSYFGIVDIAGFPKDRYYFYRSQWNEKDTTLHLLPVWQEGMVMKDKQNNVDVVVYTNAHSVKLYFQPATGGEAQLIGEKAYTEKTTNAGFKYRVYEGKDKSNKNYENYFFTFKVPFAAGTVFAKAYDVSGKEITETVGRSTITGFGPAKKIVVKASKTSLVANEHDLAYLEATVVDAEGKEVSNAALPITVKVNGEAGSLAGLDNGLQADLTPYTTGSRKSFAGKLLAIVKAQKQPGQVTVTFESAGLEPTTVNLEVTGDQKQAVSAYEMVKNYYVPLHKDVKLEETILVHFSDGSSKEMPVSWQDQAFKNDEAGTQTVKGQIKYADNQAPIEVSANVIFVDKVAAVLNYTAALEKGGNLSLPETRPAAMADATITKIEFPVKWENAQAVNVNEAGTYTVNGEAEVFGQKYPVTASIRVAEKALTGHSNQAPLASKLEQDVPAEHQSDVLEAVRDGKTQGEAVNGDTNPSIWSNYKYAQTGKQDAEITFTYATDNVFDQAKVFVYEDSWSASMPDEIKLFYAGIGGEWHEIPNVQVTKGQTPSSRPATTEVKFDFEKVTALQFKVQIHGKKGSVKRGSKDVYYCTGISEIELNSPKYEFKVNASPVPEDLRINGEKITDVEIAAGMDVEEKNVGVKLQNNATNVAVTPLPQVGDVAYVILESEDHSNLKVLRIKTAQENAGQLQPDSPKRDIPTDSMDAQAASFQPTQEANKALDGQSNTLWHTKWSEDLGNQKDKRVFELVLDEETEIEALRYLPRQDGNENGKVVKYEVYAEVNGQYQLMTSGDWDQTNAWKVAQFKPVKTRKVKLVGVQTLPNNKFMSAAEIRVRKAKPNPTQLNDQNTTISGLAESYELSQDMAAITPKVTVEFAGQILEQDLDYVVTYENNTAPGQASLIVNGIAAYRGEIKREFKITQAEHVLADNTSVNVIAPMVEADKVNDNHEQTVSVSGKVLGINQDQAITLNVGQVKTVLEDEAYGANANEKALIYDIYFTSKGERLTNIKGEFEVNIKNVEVQPLRVYDVKLQSAITDFTYDAEHQSVSFKASHFSEYSLVFKQKDQENGGDTEKPKPDPQPEQPGQPEQPEQPENPEQPVKPVQPEQPVKPEQPAQPQKDNDNLEFHRGDLDRWQAQNGNYVVYGPKAQVVRQNVVTKTGEAPLSSGTIMLVALGLAISCILIKKRRTNN